MLHKLFGFSLRRLYIKNILYIKTIFGEF